MRRLWEAIFQATRADQEDPIAAWEAHNRALHEKVAYLNARRFHALHFKGPGTDLVVGLAEGHLWQGGATATKGGRLCNPNLPTEEVFTAPTGSGWRGWCGQAAPWPWGHPGGGDLRPV